MAAGITSKVVMIDLRSFDRGNSSRYRAVASLRFDTASSMVLPWLTVPTSGHSATYMSSSLCNTAVRVYMTFRNNYLMSFYKMFWIGKRYKDTEQQKSIRWCEPGCRQDPVPVVIQPTVIGIPEKTTNNWAHVFPIDPSSRKKVPCFWGNRDRRSRQKYPNYSIEYNQYAFPTGLFGQWQCG